MNCYQCHLMFNIRRNKHTYKCGYSFCQICLTSIYRNIPSKCPIKTHKKCSIVLNQQDRSYLKNLLDKRIKVAFLGPLSAGKTTLIHSLLRSSLIPRRTFSFDLISVQRRIGNLNIQYNLWDTTSQSSILGQGYQLSLKDSNVQIIVYKDTQQIDAVKRLFDFILQASQNVHIIVVENSISKDTQTSYQCLDNVLKGKQYKYFRIDCRNFEEVDRLWSELDNKCLNLKLGLNKFRGSHSLGLNKYKSEKRQCNC